jgi:signal transduction histidine kinase
MADSDDSFTSFTRTVAEVALRNHHLDARSRKAFEDVADEASKASVLLDDMLTLARADSGSFNGILEPVDLARLWKKLVRWRAPAGRCARAFFDDLPWFEQSTTVVGDFPSLRRILWVLLDNALKYTDAPGRIEVVLNTISGRLSEIAVSVLLQ